MPSLPTGKILITSRDLDSVPAVRAGGSEAGAQEASGAGRRHVA